MPPPLQGGRVLDYATSVADGSASAPSSSIPVGGNNGVVQNNVFGKPTAFERAGAGGMDMPAAKPVSVAGPRNTYSGPADMAPAAALNQTIGQQSPYTPQPATWDRQPGQPSLYDKAQADKIRAAQPPVQAVGGVAGGFTPPGASAPAYMNQPQAPAAPVSAPGVMPQGAVEQPRPWWMNYGLEELAALPPEFAAQLPPEVLAAFSNETYVQNPHLMSRLSPEQVMGRGFDPAFLQTMQGSAPGQSMTPGSWLPNVTDIQNAGLMPPRVGEALGMNGPRWNGQGISPYYIPPINGMRPISGQTMAAMNPTDIMALEGTANMTGNWWEDYQAAIQRRSAPSGGAPGRVNQPVARY
jgi:hypothetical protein